MEVKFKTDGPGGDPSRLALYEIGYSDKNDCDRALGLKFSDCVTSKLKEGIE